MGMPLGMAANHTQEGKQAQTTNGEIQCPPMDTTLFELSSKTYKAYQFKKKTTNTNNYQML